MKTKLLIAILTFGWLCSGIALAQAPDTLFISTTQVVHIRFGSELKYVNLGNKAIVAKIVDGSKEALRAVLCRTAPRLSMAVRTTLLSRPVNPSTSAPR